MQNLLEAVPNFSVAESGAVEAIAEALGGGAEVLDIHTDTDHNRSVFTCVGEPEGLVDALAAAVAVAVEQVDLNTHVGVHPRVGAADVVPFVRFAAGDPRPRAAAEALAPRIAALGVPVFGYGELAEGLRPAHYRAGGPQRLGERLAAGEVRTLHGPQELHATAGAVLLGVRAPLVAFNVDLQTSDGAVAAEIARTVRASSGGLPGVQAIGLVLGSTGRAQVSTNLIDIDATPLWKVVAEVRRLAAEHGVEVAGSELVGLMPARVAWEAAAHGLMVADARPDRIVEVAVVGQFGSAEAR